MTDPLHGITALTQQLRVGLLLTEHNTLLMLWKNVLLYQMGARAHAGGESRDRALRLDKVGNHRPLRVRRSSGLRARGAAGRRAPKPRAASCGGAGGDSRLARP